MKHSGLWRDGLLLLIAVTALLLALFLPAAYALSEEWRADEQALLEAKRTGRIIRLHIIANSDSAADQAVKYAVRDEILRSFGESFSHCSTFEEVYSALLSNMDLMKCTALRTARSLGFDGDIKTEAGVMDLPAKQYGKVFLPQGKYHALRITLGKGEGKNWWCVLYPQLCLAASETKDDTDHIHWTSRRIFSQWLAFCK